MNQKNATQKDTIKFILNEYTENEKALFMTPYPFVVPNLNKLFSFVLRQ